MSLMLHSFIRIYGVPFPVLGTLPGTGVFVCAYRVEYHMLPAPYIGFQFSGEHRYILTETVVVCSFFRGEQNPEK